ncbi:MAG: biopolymer transporter ExbD, partial [Pseudomonadota bacterium]
NEKKNILISVSSTNRVFFNRLPIDVAAARANIERELADNPDASVVVQTEDGATIDVYTRIHDAAKLAGAKNIVLASK